MASGPTTAWPIEGEMVEVMTDFLFLGSKITVDVDWSHEIRRQLLLGRKAIANIDNVLKSRDITLLTNVRIVKAMVFPMVMYGCDSWTVKKVECQRIDAFKLWCWINLCICFSLFFLFRIHFVITAKRWCRSPHPRIRRTDALTRNDNAELGR